MPLARPRSTPERWWGRCGLLLILALYFSIVTYSSQRLSPAEDEPIHVRNGMRMLTRGAYVDPQRAWWTAPDRATPIMDIAPALLARISGQSPDYRTRMTTDFRHMRAARWVNHAVGALVLVMVFLWGAQLWGTFGGLIAAGFLAFYPLFLAHSTIVSTDLYMALGCLTAAWTIWTQLIKTPENLARWDRRMMRAGILVGLAISFAILCKLNNFVFLPIAFLAAGWAAWRSRGPAEPRRWLARGLAFSAITALLALALVVTVYDVTHPGTPSFVVRGRVIDLPCGQPLLLALNLVRKLHLNQPTVFYKGWMLPPRPKFYVVSFLMKTPLPLLLLLPLILRAALNDARHRRDGRIAVYLLSLLAGLALLFITRHIFMGLRHLLPLVVLLALLAGALGRVRCFMPRRAAACVLGLVGICLALAAGESLRVAPWHLSYFNIFGRGRMMFVDSELDWGQGLIALRQWQERHASAQPLWLAYFGNNDPADFGVKYRALLSPYSDVRPDPEGRTLRTPAQLAGRGFVAISKTHLAGTYLPAAGESTQYYAPWCELKPAFEIGDSINIYDLRPAKVASAPPAAPKP